MQGMSNTLMSERRQLRAAAGCRCGADAGITFDGDADR